MVIGIAVDATHGEPTFDPATGTSQHESHPPDFSKVSMDQRRSLTPMGIAHIAVDIDWYVAERMHTAPAIPSGDSPV